MHVLDVTALYAERSGGVRRYLGAKRRWLGRQPGVRHSLLVPRGPGVRPGSGVHTLPAAPLPGSGGYRFPIHVTPWREAIAAVAPDVVEAGDPWIPGYAARCAAQRQGIPAVGFYHSDVPRLLGRRLGRWTSGPVAAWLRRFYAGFDLVLAPSVTLTQRLRAMGIGHAHHQPLGVDVALFHPRHGDRAALLARLGLPAHTRLLVYAGRFAREKRLDVLRAAVRRLGAPYHLVLVGAERVARIDDRVTTLPFQEAGLARVLASCDALVHAGECETFGLVVLEAMACGIPVVGVEAGAVPELVRPQWGALAPPGNAGGFAEAVAAVFDTDRRALGRAAREAAERCHAWRAVFPTLLAHYRRLGVVAPAAGLEPVVDGHG